jgi:hypothetical protein
MKTHFAFGFMMFCLTLAPTAVRADAQQDQDACMMDAQTICGQFIPDRDRVAHCLMANRRHVSAGCRVALRRFK